MNIKTRLLSATAAAAILGAGVIGTATQASAQEPEPTPAIEQQGRRGRFLERIAEKLNITVEDLKAAMKAAALDAVDEALANGRITEEQAATTRERIESGKGLRKLVERRQERRDHRRDLVRKGIIESAASALNMSFDELKAELMTGDSIADVANEQGVSLDTVKAQIASDAEAKLDEAVANGKLTQERADAALAMLTEKLDEILNKSKEPAPTP